MSDREGVVFLHAFPLDARMWARQLDALGDRWRAIAPDLPGFGGRPVEGADLAGFADRVLAEMDAAGLDRAVVVGLSMGGYVALRLFDRAPERVMGMVLADTRAAPDDASGKHRRDEQAERIRREGVGWLGEALVPGLLGSTTRRENPDVVDEVERIVEESEPDGVIAALQAMRDRLDSTDLLPRVEVPVLVLVGAEDALTPPEMARAMVGHLPNARLKVLPGAGHLSNLENPRAFNDELLRFLGEVLPAST